MPICTYAEINFGFTAEWLSHESAIIAEATPVEVENIKGPGDVWITKVRFRFDKVIKGSNSNGDLVTIYDFAYNEKDKLSLSEAKTNNKQLLIFVSIADHTFNEIDGKYIFTETHQFKSAFYKDREVSNIYTQEFKRIKVFEELIKIVETQVNYEADLYRRYWEGTIEKKSLNIPGDCEAFKSLYAGSACCLWVPDYIEKK